MPAAVKKNAPGLLIQLEETYKVFLPGDVVSGTVDYNPPSSSNVIRVRICLEGQTRSKIMHTSGEARSVHRGRRILFHVSQTLSIAGMRERGSAAYCMPFSLEIPRTPARDIARIPGSLGGHGLGDEFSVRKSQYLTTSEDVTQHPLPETYNRSGDFRNEAFVEYVLTAELVDGNRPYDTQESTLPIPLRTLGTRYPIQDFRVRTRKFAVATKSANLLPVSEQPCGKRDKMRLLLHPSRVPLYSYNIICDYPTIIQLEHPDPISLRLCVLDMSNNISASTTDPEYHPQVRISSLKLCLRATTTVRAPGFVTERDSCNTTKIELLNKVFRGPDVTPASNSLILPTLLEDEYLVDCKPGTTAATLAQTPFNAPTRCFNTSPESSEVSPAPPSYQDAISNTDVSKEDTLPQAPPPHLDIGKVAGLRIARANAIIHGKPAKKYGKDIHPTFMTYNINETWVLEWTIGIVCAGEEQVVKHSAPVLIVPASEETIAIKEQARLRLMDRQGDLPAY